jgi:hypothetical protein
MKDVFDGTWIIDTTESFVWDDSLKKHVPDEIGEEVVTLRIENGVQDYEVLYGDRPKIRMGYTAPYDGTDWMPYTVREIITSASDPATELDAFKHRIKASGGAHDRRFEVGRAYGLVRLVYVDEQTHYRVSRNPIDGKAQHVMLRRMAEDGESYMARVFDVQGIVYRIRRFVRER